MPKTTIYFTYLACGVVLCLKRFRLLALNKSMPSSIQVSLETSTSRDVCPEEVLSFSNVPSSSLLYHIQKPVRSQNNILHLSPGLLKKTNRWPLKGSLHITLSANMESLLNPHRMSVGSVYMKILTDDGNVSIVRTPAKQKEHYSKPCCLWKDLSSGCCRK